MLFHRSYGNKKSQPLIFLHGFLGSGLDFLPLIEKLQEQYFCITLDLPSHGNSPYFGNTLLAVQKTLESLPENPVLIGYSLGGRIALFLSQKTNLSPKASIILSSHIGLICPIEKKIRLEEDRLWSEKLKNLSPSDFLKAWYEQPIFSSLQKKKELLKEVLQKRLFTNSLELAYLLEEMSLGKQPLLTAFSSPTYFLYGEEDTKMKNLYSTFPFSKIKIKKAGHLLHLENPDGCVRAIKNLSF